MNSTTPDKTDVLRRVKSFQSSNKKFSQRKSLKNYFCLSRWLGGAQKIIHRTCVYHDFWSALYYYAHSPNGFSKCLAESHPDEPLSIKDLNSQIIWCSTKAHCIWKLNWLHTFLTSAFTAQNCFLAGIISSCEKTMHLPSECFRDVIHSSS